MCRAPSGDSPSSMEKNMKPKLFPLAVATLLLAGLLAACGQVPEAAEEALVPVLEESQALLQEVSPAAAAVTGTVTYLQDEALDPNAVIQVELQDVSLADAPATVIDTQTISADGQTPPIPFELAYDPAQIVESSTYVVRAQILLDGELMYTSTAAVPVITNGAPTSGVEIIVEPVVASTMGGALTGTVTYLTREALAPGSVITADLVDVSSGTPYVMATTSINADGQQVPIPFALDYDPASIDPASTYLLNARIESNGQVTHATRVGTPVLTSGAPTSDVEIVVEPAAGATSAFVRGVVTSASPELLDPAAVLQVEIVEPMLADAPAVATISIPVENQTFPISFELPYDPALIDQNKDYVLGGRIRLGSSLIYESGGDVPVLTKGAPSSDVTLLIVPYGTASAGGTGSAGGGGGLITGLVTTAQPAQLDPSATLFIDLREEGTTGEPLLTISALLDGQQFPIPFEVPYSPSLIDPNKTYVVGGRIMMGDRPMYASAVGVPVITQGAPTSNVDMPLVPQPSP